MNIIDKSSFPINFYNKSNFYYWVKKGFTLVELILSISLFSTIFLIMTYFVWEVAESKATAESYQEILHNMNFILEKVTRELHGANDLINFSNTSVTTRKPNGTLLTFSFDTVNKTFVAQQDGLEQVVLSTKSVEVTGSFENISDTRRSRNLGIVLSIKSKNPSNISYFSGELTASTAIELTGR